jgi:alpha-galactosidase
VLCLPDTVHVMTDDTRPHTAVSATEGVWTVRGAQVTAERTAGGLRVCVRAGTEGLLRIVLRWRHNAPEDARILGDAWERGYGDLQWRTLQTCSRKRASTTAACTTGAATPLARS